MDVGDEAPAPGGAADRHAAVVRAITAMRSGLARPQPLTALARNGMFSPHYFHRFFTDVTGLTPAGFHAALRMAEARRLLLDTGLSIRRVGERVGYRSPGTFGTRFARIAGLTPARFRAAVRRLGDERADRLLVAQAADAGEPAGATLSLSGAPPRGWVALGRLYPCDAAGRAEGGQWSVWTSPGPVRLPVAPGPGAYAVLTVVVPGGIRLAEVLVDRPGSYLMGRSRVALTSVDQSAVRAHAVVRWPRLTDPPSLAIASIGGLVPIVG